MGLTPRDHTKATLARMGLSGSDASDNNRPTREDDAGHEDKAYTKARSSAFKLYGAAAAVNMGRPGRSDHSSGVRAPTKLSGELQRTLRTPKEAHEDRLDEDGRLGALNNDRPTRATGGRIGRSTGGSATAKDEYTQAGRTAGNLNASGKDQITGGDYAPNHASGGRIDRARGGRTKGKTTVNVIIGGDKHLPPQMPPPMSPPPMAAPPGPVGPPPGPPGGPPGMPGGGPPPGGMPPPGMPPMRARGGRIGRDMGGGMPMGPPPGSAGPGGPGAAGMAPPQGAAPAGPPAFSMPGGGPMPAEPGPPPGYTPAPVGAAAAQAGQNMGGPPPMSPQMQAMQQAAQNGPPAFTGPMPGRAKGGRIEIGTPGVHNFGKPGVKHASPPTKYGGGSGLGRAALARKSK